MKEYSAKTLEEALQIAADEKGCQVSDLKYFLKEEKKGLLGLGASVTVEAFNSDDVKEFIFDYLGTFFTNIDLDLECGIEEKDGGYIVRLNGENNAILIGKNGKTLQGLNVLLRSVMNAEFRTYFDLLVDVNNYKESRYHRIRQMAKKLGRQVQKTHVDVELDPMANDERKIVHKTLSTWHNLKTESEGEGQNRHICIRYVEDSTSEENLTLDNQDTTEAAND